MGWKSTEAQNEDVRVQTITQEPRNVDRYHATRVEILRPDPNDIMCLQVRVEYLRGYDDNGTFIPVDADAVLVQAADALPVMGTMSAEGELRGDGFKQMVWDALMAVGKVPAGDRV